MEQAGRWAGEEEVYSGEEEVYSKQAMNEEEEMVVVFVVFFVLNDAIHLRDVLGEKERVRERARARAE